MRARVAAVLIESSLGRRYVQASLVRRIDARPSPTAIPGTRVGLSLVASRSAVTIDLGSGPHALVCDVDGELALLAGVDVEQVGFFDGHEDAIDFDGARVPRLDVRAVALAALTQEQP